MAILTRCLVYYIIVALYAVLAQLVERIHGKDEVSGSIPEDGSRVLIFLKLTMKDIISVNISKRITNKIKDFEEKEWHVADIEHYGRDRNFVKKKHKLVATNKAGDILGVLDLVTKANVALIESLLVGSKYRRQGIGGILISEAEHIARKNKCNKIWLEIDDCWDIDRFYKKNNYTVTGTHEKHYLNRKGLIFTKYL